MSPASLPIAWSPAQPILGMLDLGMLLLKILAVLGGASLGAFLAGFVSQFLVKVWSKRTLPGPVLFVIRLLGALALGLAVWLWVTGPGGSGFGWGGSSGLGGRGEGTAGPATKPEPSPPETTVPPADTASPEAETLRVDMLGGQRVQEQRFYVLEGQKQPLTLGELRQTLRERRQQKEKPPLKGIDIVIYENSVSKDHPAVRELEKWARENDLAVSLSFPKQEAP